MIEDARDRMYALVASDNMRCIYRADTGHAAAVSSKLVDIYIDLASGSIFKDSRGVIKLASIPNVFYPLSAGRVYADGIIGALGGKRK